LRRGFRGRPRAPRAGGERFIDRAALPRSLGSARAPGGAGWLKTTCLARQNFWASDALIDEVAVGGVAEAHRQADKRVEGGACMAPSILAKDELIEITVEMGLPHPVKGAEAPALEVGEHSMDPRQYDMSGHAADHLALVLVLFEAAIGLQPVTDDRGAGRDDATDEAGNARRREVLEPVEPDVPGSAISGQLHRADEQQFADVAATLTAGRRIVPGP